MILEEVSCQATAEDSECSLYPDWYGNVGLMPPLARQDGDEIQ